MLDDLGMAGIAIGSQGGGTDLDDPVNDDLWALLSERGTFVFMHPSGMPAGPRLKDFWMPQLVGYPMETAIAVARLTFGRVLERFPLHLCLAHGGGCVPSLRGRLDMGWDRKDVAHTTAVPPERVHRSAVLRHRGVQLDGAAAPDRRGRRCRPRPARHRPPVRARRPRPAGDRPGARARADADSRAILGDNAAKLLGLPVTS